MRNIKVSAAFVLLLILLVTACTTRQPQEIPKTSDVTASGEENQKSKVTSGPEGIEILDGSASARDPAQSEAGQSPSPDDDTAAESGYTAELQSLLPPYKTEMRYSGLAEYGHFAKWDGTVNEPYQIIYEVTGNFDDGSGIPGSFKINYIMNTKDFTVTERVIENSRTGGKKINSIIPDLVILKAPLGAGSSWQQQIGIDGHNYLMNAVITDVQTVPNETSSKIYTVRYTVEGIPNYFKNTYIEERRFRTGKGMTGFQQLMPGDIGLSGKDLEDEVKVGEALANHMFGYGLNIINP